MGYPYMQPGYAPAPSKPGGGSAITAGVLALLQGLVVTAAAVAAAVGTRQDRAEGYANAGEFMVVGVLAAIGALFLSGAILLFCRRKAGRYILIVLTTLVVVVTPSIGVVAAFGGTVDPEDVLPFGIVVAVVFVIELPILVCAAMSSTGRWIAVRTADPYAPPVAYPYY